MDAFEKQNGVSFIILYYTEKNEAYYIPFKDIKRFYERAENGGRKSFRYDEINKNYLINQNKGVPIHFLEMLNMDLNERE